MAGLKFEGDLSQIIEVQLEFIRSIIEQRGYTNNQVVIEPVGKAGDNYIASVQRIIVEDGNGGTFKMVAKIAPVVNFLRNLHNVDMLFRNETIMYTKVLPKFTQLQEAADVPPKERLKYAACYGSLDVVPHEVILLEDLKESNFLMLDKIKPISSDCVKSVLKNFASLHSSSYALKHKEPELFEEYKNSLFDLWAFLGGQDEMMVYFKKTEDVAINLVDSDIHKKALDGALIRLLKDSVKMGNYEKHSQYAIIQQGDAWNNNIMFKFHEDTPLESIMIDYQISKVTSPAADILYMIFNCTDHESRMEHFHEWIDYYHSELDKYLYYYGLKAKFVFPRDQLDTDLKRFGKVAFAQSVLLAGVVSMKSEEAAEVMKAMKDDDVQKILESENAGMTDPATLAIYKKRLQGLVDSFYEFGLI